MPAPPPADSFPAVDGSVRAPGFPPPDGHVWLNTAHQGVLPERAAAAAREAIERKRRPHRIADADFRDLPERLRSALGRLLGAPADEIVLANSASYGLHLLANGIPWRDGDEVLVLDGDFPSDVLPWLGLAERGVTLRRIRPRHGPIVRADDLEANVTARSRLFCTTWVHSFSGFTADLASLGEVCRRHGITFVVNGSQAVGARPVELAEWGVDAFTSVGWKWLCGPYGTGFLWLRSELLSSLRYNQTYWQAFLGGAAGLEGNAETDLDRDLGCRRYDLFGTANFFNFEAFVESVEHVTRIGAEAARAHGQALVSRLLEAVRGSGLEVLSPLTGDERSNLVLLRHRRDEVTARIARQLRRHLVHGALRRGNLRFSPHLHNDASDVDRASQQLLEAVAGA